MRIRRLQLIPYAIFIALWLAMFISRPLLPVDETRYATVAWEMWNNGNFLVPHLNGLPYSHKPPLLFWLINLGWLLFGVSELWARLVPALFGLGCLGLLKSLAGYMWPREKSAALLAPYFFIGCLGIAFYGTALRFDLPMIFFILASLLYLWRFVSTGNTNNWIGVGVMIGLAILTKGPVTFVYLLPGILLAPWWLPRDKPFTWRRWYGGFALALLLALATVGLWLIPTLFIADADYLRETLLTQTSERIAGNLGPDKPIWFYLPWLMLFTLPWILWLPFWQGIKALWTNPNLHDAAVRCLALTLGINFLFFTFIGSKHAHYLLPSIGLISLLAAHAISTGVASADRQLLWPITILYLGVGLFVIAISLGLKPDDWPEWTNYVPALPGVLIVLAGFALAWLEYTDPIRTAITITLTTSVVVLAVTFGPIHPARIAIDLHNISRFIALLHWGEKPVAVLGRYRGEFTFIGRLWQPVLTVNPEQMDDWLRGYPDGFTVVIKSDRCPDLDERAVFFQDYRTGRIWVFENLELLLFGLEFDHCESKLG